MSQVKQNRSEHRCNACQGTGHIARNCTVCVCTHCSRFGHHDSMCPEKEAFEELKIWFRPDMDVRCCIATEKERNAINIDAYKFWVSLKNVPPYEKNGIKMRPVENSNALALSIPYRGRIVVSLQIPGSKRETQLFVNRYRAQISKKFFIEGTMIKEFVERSATGTDDLTAPGCDIHVILVAQNMFDDVVAMHLNRRHYFLQWMQIVEQGQPRHAVHVSSRESFCREQMMKEKPAVLNVRRYFVSMIEQTQEQNTVAEIFAENQPTATDEAMQSEEPTAKMARAASAEMSSRKKTQWSRRKTSS